MPLDGEYEPCSWGTAADQVARIEASGGTEGTVMGGAPCVVLWTRGVRSGKVRKTPVIRVTDGTAYAAVGSMGGAPKDPSWVGNLRADGRATVQDGTTVLDVVARELVDEEKAAWWRRATEVWPAYDEYQAKTDRSIPVFVLEPS